jgi:hypothetical protein
MIKTDAVMKIAIVTAALLPAMLVISSLPFDLYGVGILSGWLGTGLICASLLLMIRESVWAAWFGHVSVASHHGRGWVCTAAGTSLASRQPFFRTGSRYRMGLFQFSIYLQIYTIHN